MWIPPRIYPSLRDRGEVRPFRFRRAEGALRDIPVGVRRLNRKRCLSLGGRRFRKAGVHVLVVLTSRGLLDWSRATAVVDFNGLCARHIQRRRYPWRVSSSSLVPMLSRRHVRTLLLAIIAHIAHVGVMAMRCNCFGLLQGEHASNICVAVPDAELVEALRNDRWTGGGGIHLHGVSGWANIIHTRKWRRRFGPWQATPILVAGIVAARWHTRYGIHIARTSSRARRWLSIIRSRVRACRGVSPIVWPGSLVSRLGWR